MPTGKTDCPSGPGRWQALKTDWTGDRYHVVPAVAEMARHLAALAAGVALGKISQRDVGERSAHCQKQSAVAVVRINIVARFQARSQCRDALVPGRWHLEIAFTLTEQDGLPAIAFS